MGNLLQAYTCSHAMTPIPRLPCHLATNTYNLLRVYRSQGFVLNPIAAGAALRTTSGSVPHQRSYHPCSSVGSRSSSSSSSSSSSRRRRRSTVSYRCFGDAFMMSFDSRRRLLRAPRPEGTFAFQDHKRPLHTSRKALGGDDFRTDGGGGGDDNHDDDDDAVSQATLRWVRSTVVGLNLCPWAGGALTGGHMKVVVHPLAADVDAVAAGAPDDAAVGASGKRVWESGSSTMNSGIVEIGPGIGSGAATIYGEDVGLSTALEGLVNVAARQATALGELEGEAAANATTLVVARPPVAENFQDFLDVVEAVDGFIDDAGLRGTVQLATFHPEYRFEGTEEDDASNYTNRSPYPVLHLLLEDQVSKAVAQIGNAEKVWQKNVQTTRKLGVEAMRRGMEACLATAAAKPSGNGKRKEKGR